MARIKYAKKSDKPTEKRRKSSVYVAKWKMLVILALLGIESVILLGVLAKWLLN